MICGNAARNTPTGWRALLEAEVRKIPQVKIAWKVEANGVFAQIPRHAIEKIMDAVLLLSVDRGGVHRALDVLVRHDGRGCEGLRESAWRRQCKGDGRGLCELLLFARLLTKLAHSPAAVCVPGSLGPRS